MPIFDIESVRRDFPLIVNETLEGRVYLDNAATSQKPKCVLDTINHYYAQQNANVHRASHHLSTQATLAYEEAREAVRHFLNARSREEIVWTSGATAAINLVANSYGRRFLQPGDEILLSECEHHSNIVPWQLLAEERGLTLRYIPVLPTGELDLSELSILLNERTKLVALAHVSNSLGMPMPVERVIEAAKRYRARVLIDGSQAVAHDNVDVQALDCDFYVFSGHKVFGPSGIGVLYGKYELLEIMPPWQGGGEMIEQVSKRGATFTLPPLRFEAGTPHIAGAIGLASALRYLSTLDRQAAAEYERYLLNSMESLCADIPGFQLVGGQGRTSIMSFLVKGMHPQDIGTLMDMQGIAVRVGHHCAMPMMEALGLSGTIRASLAFYNNLDDVERFVDALRKAVTEF
ncbi:cysteine desulfurase [Pokkaliibacter sp. MBI-7]|uniref:aminotransferase class V-fold PLP-dependent enzyme n=1 Tax=Pokkaliibacter sp. MBI-7 TaxID=3040600 RepID=UPI00244977B2|nr:cysteine desulfurase [Pokkaliibacter sp. MBI-7]MDH2435748.1 cysteine desulfurase [Pokkaliibacter sp. MBI-7]